jgi:hypothetical protein
MPTFMFFGRLDNDRAICMDVRSFRWFNHGAYTEPQLKKLKAVGTQLLAENEAYKRCTQITVAEYNGSGRIEIKGARVTR